MADRSFLDWPFFEPHHRQLADDLERWSAAHLARFAGRHGDDVDAACRAILQALGDGGWLRYAVPAAYGGRFEVLDVRCLCLIRETLARHCGLADFVFAMQGLGSGAIGLFGAQDLKRKYLPGVAAGRLTAAFALTEPDSGSDVAATASSAVEDGDHYVVNGTKTFISNGGIADFYTTFLRTGQAPGAGGLSAIVVDAGTPGLEIAERIAVMAPHPLATLRFNDMRIAKSQLVGVPGAGFKQAMATLDVFRATVGAAALGFARRALDAAIERARTRRMFGATLAEQPLAQAQLAEMALDIDASALLVYRAAWTQDVRRTRVTREAAMAKLFATDRAQTVIDKAVQLFGGLGVVSGVTVEELYREIRALRIYEGASEVQKLVIARRLLAPTGDKTT
ncbi:MAG: acyl-CoA dehydrogenase family protein [Gammaproteobacteria bacterium]|nr:acyl-CoA dehydrogenase family protein [Gammaproteobacteria bacterium]